MPEPDNHRTTRIQVMVSAELASTINGLADAVNLPVSSYIHGLLLVHVERKRKIQQRYNHNHTKTTTQKKA